MEDSKNRLKSYEERAFEQLGDLAAAAHNQMLTTHAFYAQALSAAGLAVERSRAHSRLNEERQRQLIDDVRELRHQQVIIETERDDLRAELCRLRAEHAAVKAGIGG